MPPRVGKQLGLGLVDRRGRQAEPADEQSPAPAAAKVASLVADDRTPARAAPAVPVSERSPDAMKPPAAIIRIEAGTGRARHEKNVLAARRNTPYCGTSPRSQSVTASCFRAFGLELGDGGFDGGNDLFDGHAALSRDLGKRQRMTDRRRQACRRVNCTGIQMPAVSDVADRHPGRHGLVLMGRPIGKPIGEATRKQQRKQREKNKRRDEKGMTAEG